MSVPGTLSTFRLGQDRKRFRGSVCCNFVIAFGLTVQGTWGKG